MDCSLPGSSVHVFLQARILECVVMPFSRGSSKHRDWTLISNVSCIGRSVLYHLSHLGSPWKGTMRLFNPNSSLRRRLEVIWATPYSLWARDWGANALTPAFYELSPYCCCLVAKLCLTLKLCLLFASPWTAACQAPRLSLSPGISSNSCPLSQWHHPFSYCRTELSAFKSAFAHLDVLVGTRASQRPTFHGDVVFSENKEAKKQMNNQTWDLFNVGWS